MRARAKATRSGRYWIPETSEYQRDQANVADGPVGSPRPPMSRVAVTLSSPETVLGARHERLQAPPQPNWNFPPPTSRSPCRTVNRGGSSSANLGISYFPPDASTSR